MIFSKPPSKMAASSGENDREFTENKINAVRDEVDTVVGPSVTVEGDFASEGNIIVKGNVIGSVHTSKHLFVEPGARIMANVRAGSAKVAGEVKGNMKIKETLEMTSTAKALGDIEAKVLVVEAGALLHGKVAMPGLDLGEGKISGRFGRSVLAKKTEDASVASN